MNDLPREKRPQCHSLVVLQKPLKFFIKGTAGDVVPGSSTVRNRESKGAREIYRADESAEPGLKGKNQGGNEIHEVVGIKQEVSVIEEKGIEKVSDSLKVSDRSVVGSETAGSGSRKRGRIYEAPSGRKAWKDAKAHKLFQV